MTWFYRLFKFASWPVLTGLLAAALVLVLYPQLLNNNGDREDDVELSPLSPQGDAMEGPVSYAEAVKRAAPSVVNIYTQKKLSRPSHPLLDDPFFRRFFSSGNRPQQERIESSLGSGVIISGEGYILTNNHVVDDADQIIVQLNDGREAQAAVVGKDTETDLAVLRIQADNLAAISIGHPQQAQVGDVVLAIGNPFGLVQSVSQGIISAVGRQGLGLNTFENFLQTDAAINPGNSGGALIDAYGNLLGINSAIPNRTGYSVGIGFAIPADTALKVLEDIVQYGKVIRGWLGVEARTLNPEIAERLNLDPPVGLVITNVVRGSPAELAGLTRGDIITRINNHWVGQDNRGLNLIAQLSPGDSVQLQIWRQGTISTVMAVAGTRPTPAG